MLAPEPDLGPGQFAGRLSNEVSVLDTPSGVMGTNFGSNLEQMLQGPWPKLGFDKPIYVVVAVRTSGSLIN